MARRQNLVPKDMLPYVHRLLSARHVTSGMRKVAYFDAYDDLYWIALVNLTSFPEPTSLDAEDHALKQQILEAVLDHFAARGERSPSAEDIDEDLRQTIAAHEKTQPRVYRTVFPLHAQGDWVRHKRVFSVQGTQFTRLGLRRARELPGWAEFYMKARKALRLCSEHDDKDIERRFTWWVAEVRAQSADLAFSRASTAFDLLRAVLNYAAHCGKYTVRIGGIPGHPEPMGALMPAPVFGVLGDGGEVSTWGSRFRYNYSSGGRLLDEECGRAVTILTRISQMPEDLGTIMAQMLLQYGEAMDTTDWRVAYLSLWQVLEIAVRSFEYSVRDDRVRRRMCCLLRRGAKPHDGDLLEPLLRAFEGLRHVLVHKGRFTNEGFRHASALCFVAEMAIESFLDCCRHFRTKEDLIEFYGQGVCESRTLEARAAAIAHIQRARRRHRDAG